MEIMERINRYWSHRADEFGDSRYADMHSPKKDKWQALIAQHLPEMPCRALDLGTGGGFFAFILKELGCSVTAIDYSEDMLANARKNAEKLGYDDIVFMQMDAQDLQFPDGNFDFIFTRNVTWTLPNPEKAYLEMLRVLAPSGKLMNADANYAAAFRYMDEQGLTGKEAVSGDEKYAHPARSIEMIRERNDIAKSLSIAEEDRPLWDLHLLMEHGVQRFWLDMDVNTNVFGYLRPDTSVPQLSPEFVLVARK